MNKLYLKNELWFSIAFIIIYCASTIPIRGELGDDSIWMLIALLIISFLIVFFVRKNKLESKYGLDKLPKNSKKFLYFIPLIILATGNLWGGIKLSYTGLPLLYALLSMTLIGFVEEMIFRGFLFKAIEKRRNIKLAIIISSITFGIGHIINILAGQANLTTIIQVIFAISMGFVFVYTFYKSKSMWPCIILHSVVDILSKIGNVSVKTDLIYMIVGIIISILYCLYLNKVKIEK